MTNNWEWHRRGAGDEGAEGGAGQQGSDARPGGSEAPPPWDGSGSAADPAAGQAQDPDPWARPPIAGGETQQGSPWSPTGGPGTAGEGDSPSYPGTQAPGYGRYAAPSAGYGPSYDAGGQATPSRQRPDQTSPYGSPSYGNPSYGTDRYGGVPGAQTPYPNAPYGGTAPYPAPGGFGGAYGASPYGMQPYGFGGPQVPMRPRMGFLQAMTAFVQNYARFSGRAGLSEYWWTVLGNFLVVMVLELLLATAGASADGSMNLVGTLAIVLLAAWALGTIVPNLSVAVRRLHDTNRSGLAYLLNFVPMVGGIIVLVFTLGGSDPAGARFDGPDQPRIGD